MSDNRLLYYTSCPYVSHIPLLSIGQVVACIALTLSFHVKSQALRTACSWDTFCCSVYVEYVSSQR